MNLPWAELLLAGLRDAGAGDLVISPGSRSTPLVLAAARLALPCHVIIDERVAGFFALGRARVTGRPSVLVCTSGTAGAHYLPAVIEAAMAHVPLLIVTADRPPELKDCGAPQAIDQTPLYGRFARGFCDLGIPEAVPESLRGLRRRAAQMTALARWPEPGPVHINVPARVPLEPAAHPGPDERRMIELASAIAAERFSRSAPVRAAVSDDTIAELAAACRGVSRGLLVAGPAPLSRSDAGEPDAIFALAAATGFPLLAEATSQLRWTGRLPPSGLCDAFDLTLRAPRRGALAAPPEVIVELGAPPTSAAWARYLAQNRRCTRIVIAPHGWLDPHGGAALMVAAEVGAVAGRVAAQLPCPAPPGEWSEAWRGADRRARASLERAIGAAEPAGAGAGGRRWLGEHAAVRTVAGALPERTLLFLGNSLPVRVADTACPADARRIDVLGQRGACGIDGLVAGAAGAASAAGRPTALLLGDVSFAHDLGGLAAARLARAALAVVVIDNGGGRIFEHLPLAGAPGGAEALERFYITPPEIDLAAAAAAFGIPYRRAEDAAALGAAVENALSAPAGATLVHAVVAPHSARDVERAALALLAEET